MTTAVLDRPAAPMPAPARPATLEHVVARAWSALTSHEAATCLVCGGTMTPRYGASGPSPVGGRCGDCGSTLG